MCKIRGALRTINDGGKWTFRPITDYSFVLPDYPYSVNVSAQTKLHFSPSPDNVDTFIYREGNADISMQEET